MCWQTKQIKVSVGALIFTQHHRKRQVTRCVDQAKRHHSLGRRPD